MKKPGKCPAFLLLEDIFLLLASQAGDDFTGSIAQEQFSGVSLYGVGTRLFQCREELLFLVHYCRCTHHTCSCRRLESKLRSGNRHAGRETVASTRAACRSIGFDEQRRLRIVDRPTAIDILHEPIHVPEFVAPRGKRQYQQHQHGNEADDE